MKPKLERPDPTRAPAASENATARERRRWPIEPTTGQPLPPRAQPGYYPGYNTLSQQEFWDPATRKVVLDRVENVPSIRFFSPEEARLMEAVVNRIIPQDDRQDAYRIPIVPRIDEKLFVGRMPGYRYADMPDEQEAARLGLQGIEAIAGHLFGRSFVDLQPTEQDEILFLIHDNKPPAGEHIWRRLPIAHFWTQLLTDCAEAYYAHPYAWDEIGFGGPAYPRGYMRLRGGEPEPWEVEEQRYAWAPPPDALSGNDKPLPESAGMYSPGQAGTH